MRPTNSVLLAADAANALIDISSTLTAGRLAFAPCSFQGPQELSFYAICIIDSAGAEEAAAIFARRWRRERGADSPLLWIADQPELRVAGWQVGADAALSRPFLPTELIAQVESFQRQLERNIHSQAIASEARRINHSAIGFYERLEAENRIARRIQQANRPAQLPVVQRARFALSHRARPGGGSDFYGIASTDEQHTSFYLGDVMGCSLTACLLSIFVQQIIAIEEKHGNSSGLIPPDEILRRIHRHLKSLGLPEPPLVRLTYGLLSGRTGELHYAGAGQTPPLFLPRQGSPSLWREVGPLLGAPEGRHALKTVMLQPGDRVLLYTDGLQGGTPETVDEMLAAADRHRDLPLAALGEALTQELLTRTREPDEFTLLALEWQ